MANPNKYNDNSATDNIYGDLMKNTDSTSNNGRTPPNPKAQNPMKFNLSVNESDAKKTSFGGPVSA